jgi:hypothetical protein
MNWKSSHLIAYRRLESLLIRLDPLLEVEGDEWLHSGALLLYHESSSSKALASCRSAVSKPSVNQLYTGASRS